VQTCGSLGCGRELSLWEVIRGCSRATEHPRLEEEEVSRRVNARLAAAAHNVAQTKNAAEEVTEPTQNIEKDAVEVNKPTQIIEESAGEAKVSTQLMREAKVSTQLMRKGAEEVIEPSQIFEKDVEEVNEPARVVEQSDAEEGEVEEGEVEEGEIEEGEVTDQEGEVNSPVINYKFAEAPTGLKRRRSSSADSGELPRIQRDWTMERRMKWRMWRMRWRMKCWPFLPIIMDILTTTSRRRTCPRGGSKA
jgi:hypothetical protein